MTEVDNQKVIPALTSDTDDLNKRIADAIDMSFAKLHNDGIIQVETKENSIFSDKQGKYVTWIIFAVIVLLAICIIFFFK